MKRNDNRAERLFSAMGGIDDRHIVTAAVKTPKSRSFVTRMVALAASFAIVVGLSLYLFLPLNDAPNISKYKGSEYYPVVERLADYYYRPHGKPNNFLRLASSLRMFWAPKNDAADPGDAPEVDYESSVSLNGSYVEVTDNQVAGVIEADLMKATTENIYRISRVGRYMYLRIYSMSPDENGEYPTEPISETLIPAPADCGYANFSGKIHPLFRQETAEMYLSADASTVTLVMSYADNLTGETRTALYSINVSDINTPAVENIASVSGLYSTSRKIGDKILLVANRMVSNPDYDNPESFVPTVDGGEGRELMPMENIVLPDKAASSYYSVVSLFSEGDGRLVDTIALFDYTNAIYVTESSIYAAHSYSEATDTIRGINRNMTEIAHISIGDTLEINGKMTLEGSLKDQYSLDEKDGFLRAVTTTNVRTINGKDSFTSNASLYVFDLSDYSERVSVKYFAPNGEGVESVRFDGDKLYVCTALRITMTDPVFFFDLSDYDRVTSVDTGTIDGFSSSLIQLKDGYLLGVGEGRGTNKLEIYKKDGAQVVSTDVFEFGGAYSRNYKSYLINREAGIFALGVNSLYYETDEGREYHDDCYLILSVKDGKFSVIATTPIEDSYPDSARALYYKDKIFLTTNGVYKVIELDNLG